MQKLFTILLISIFTFLFVSCKNEINTDKTENTNAEITDKPSKRAQKRELTQADIAEINSVMSRVMSNPSLQKFASYLVTADLANMLSAEEGPYTVFAPSSSALESFTVEKKKFYANPENKAKLEEMLKSHIVEGIMDNQNLLKAINKSGKTKLQTLAGVTLTASKVGDDIVIADGKGGKATIVNDGVTGSNGVVFVVDGVMNAN